MQQKSSQSEADEVRGIGFLINPIAGMGGRVGLKGTDALADRARALGAEPIANDKASAALRALRQLLDRETRLPRIRWLTASGAMGADALAEAGFEDVAILRQTSGETTSEDTRHATAAFLEAGADLILFCGGDGTARDVAGIAGETVPVLGIPAGVKMFSGVFAVSPPRAAEILAGFLEGRLTPSPVEILDLDEERYRAGEWCVRLYLTALTPYEPELTQQAKVLIEATADADVKAEIADFIAELIEVKPDRLTLLGPGSTVAEVGKRLAIDKTLLGVDAYLSGKQAGRDLDERRILDLLDDHPDCILVLSPIGAQGFVLGRGNLQLSPPILRRIGRDNLVVIATPAKLARTGCLRVDTGDADLDREIVGNGYLPVVTGDRRRRMIRIAS